MQSVVRVRFSYCNIVTLYIVSGLEMQDCEVNVEIIVRVVASVR